jgi:hypothetical protein
MTSVFPAHLFLLGNDYHLGDLLWLTVVAAEYRRQIQPQSLVVGCPDRRVNRILERDPLIDEVVYGPADFTLTTVQARFGEELVVHDLRPLPIGLAMVRHWRQRLPWFYYRDLWLCPRGQWLATFLGLGLLREHRPVLQLTVDDRVLARELPRPYVLLAPHIGRYKLPLANAFWNRLKAWPWERWVELADRLRQAGYQPVTVGSSGQSPIPGTRAMIDYDILQVAGAIEGATALVTVESGLWFIAAALKTPLLIAPWWLPRSVDWVAPMGVPYRLVYRGQDSVDEVLAGFHQVRVRESILALEA